MSESIDRILIVDDHSMVREGLAAIIHSETDMEVTAMAGSSEEAIKFLKKSSFDVIIVDFHLPDFNGIELIRMLAPLHLEIRWILLTMHKHPALREEAALAGAHGFVLKDAACDELIHAIRDSASGPIKKACTPSVVNFDLSHREKEVLQGLARGMISKEIAGQLGVGTKTVETYRERLMQKTGSRNIAELIRLAYELGML